MNKPISKGINTVYLPVTNPYNSALWYEKYLGLRIIRPVETASTQAQLGFPNGQALFLIKTNNKINANFIEIDGYEQCPITIEVSNIEKLHQQFSDEGLHLDQLDDNGDCGKNFYLYDPDGNKLDIWSGWPVTVTFKPIES